MVLEEERNPRELNAAAVTATPPAVAENLSCPVNGAYSRMIGSPAFQLRLSSVSENTRQPPRNSESTTVPNATTTTCPPRFVASLRASVSADTNSLCVARKRLLVMKVDKPGTAIPNMTAMTISVTSSSISVKPLGRPLGRTMQCRTDLLNIVGDSLVRDFAAATARLLGAGRQKNTFRCIVPRRVWPCSRPRMSGLLVLIKGNSAHRQGGRSTPDPLKRNDLFAGPRRIHPRNAYSSTTSHTFFRPERHIGHRRGHFHHFNGQNFPEAAMRFSTGSQTFT
jgi:hypothetical protein